MELKLTSRGKAVIVALVGLAILTIAAVFIWVAVSRVDADQRVNPTLQQKPPSQELSESSEAASVTPTNSPASMSADDLREEAQRLRDSGENHGACLVEYLAEGVAAQYFIETSGTRFKHVPLALRDDVAFAGWYRTADSAAAYDLPSRINNSHIVECPEGELTFHGSFKDRESVRAEDARIPILMYHQFTSNPGGEDNDLRANYAYTGDFETHLAYIKERGFYLPTWDELNAFIDGDLSLPSHSVIISDDDAHPTWYELGVPIVDKHQVMTTSFVITAGREIPPTPSDWVLQRSHTHEMHIGGEDGQGVITSWPSDRIVADLQTSAEILGASEVLAYPFGHYNDSAKDAVAAAGFSLARTTEEGYVRVGTDKLALPTIRINYGMGVDELASVIG